MCMFSFSLAIVQGCIAAQVLGRLVKPMSKPLYTWLSRAVPGLGGLGGPEIISRPASNVQHIPNPLTCLRLPGLSPLDVGYLFSQFPLYLCHYCPPHEYAT